MDKEKVIPTVEDLMDPKPTSIDITSTNSYDDSTVRRVPTIPSYSSTLAASAYGPVSNYLSKFRENYGGISDEAKELSKSTVVKKKKTSSASVDYIPWAIILRLAKQQDTFLKVEKVRNDIVGNEFFGTLLWYNGRPGKDDANYFVKVRTVFLGNEVIEEYPCQDFDFEPVNYEGRKRILASGKTKDIKLDSNITNKALQRALTKSLCINTGLGLALYEGLDLQFEDDTEDIAVTTPKVSVPKEPKVVSVEMQITKEQLDIIKVLSEDEEKKARIKKALSAYSVEKVGELTTIQAENIIKALGGK